jgi:Undecaprenyl-phosphate galactose phosphotransferase WbaP
MGTESIALSSVFPSSRRQASIPWLTSTCLVTADLFALSITYWISVFGRYSLGGQCQLSYYLHLFPAVTLFIAGFYMQDLYPGLLLHPAEEIRRVFRSVTTVFLLITSTTFLWHNADAYSRAVIVMMWTLGGVSVLVARHMTRTLLSSRSWWGVPAVVLGYGAAARRVTRFVNSNRTGLRITGVLTDSEPFVWSDDHPPLLGTLQDAPAVVRKRLPRYVIVVMPHPAGYEVCHAIQKHCVGFRHVLLIPDLPGVSSLHISAREIGGELVLEVPQRLFHYTAAITKRLIDMLGSLSALLVLSPLLAAVALLVRLTSPGTVFYGHSRFGRNDSIFKAWKFRTMVSSSDEVLSRHLNLHPQARQEWDRDRKLKNDPRVTAVGKWLRRYSLDELPQLWNVLIGDMSLVGPRPIVRSEIDKYGPAYDLYKRVLPGITGLWQVSGRNNTTYDERIAFDQYYVRNWSVWLDAYILARTIRTVITGDGAF